MPQKFAFEKEKSKKKFFFAVAIALAVLVIAFAFFFLPQKNIELITVNNLGQEPSSASISLESQRLQYSIPAGVFEELPKAPNDFNRLVSLLHENKFKNYAFFSKEYFLQPEFYPSFKNGLHYWTNPNPNYYAAIGFGFFPAEQQIIIERGSSTVARFFVHASFGVQSFQGIRLEPVLPENAKFLSVKIFDPEFLLSPTFPKFSKNWAKAVDAKISAEENALPGTHEIIFKVIQPSEESALLWQSKVNGKYFNASSGGASVFHKIIVVVK